MRALLLLALVPLAACWEDNADPGECRIDRDCSAGVCTRVGQCESENDIYALRVEWTVHGLSTDQPGACADISELELGIEAPSTGDRHRVAPVPCAPGSFFYDKIPVTFTDVTLTAYGNFGEYLDARTASAIGSGGLVTFALLP